MIDNLIVVDNLVCGGPECKSIYSIRKCFVIRNACAMFKGDNVFISLKTNKLPYHEKIFIYLQGPALQRCSVEALRQSRSICKSCPSVLNIWIFNSITCKASAKSWKKQWPTYCSVKGDKVIDCFRFQFLNSQKGESKVAFKNGELRGYRFVGLTRYFTWCECKFMPPSVNIRELRFPQHSLFLFEILKRSNMRILLF